MSWREIRGHTCINSWLIAGLYIIFLLINVHGCLRNEQQKTINFAEEEREKARSGVIFYDGQRFLGPVTALESLIARQTALENELKAHEETIHYGH